MGLPKYQVMSSLLMAKYNYSSKINVQRANNQTILRLPSEPSYFMGTSGSAYRRLETTRRRKPTGVIGGSP